MPSYYWVAIYLEVYYSGWVEMVLALLLQLFE